MKRKYLIMSLVLLVLITLSFCNQQKQGQSSTVVKEFIFDKSFDEAARFIAAKDVDPNSKWHALSQSKQYLQYKANIDSIWQRYTDNSINLVKPWRDKELSDIDNETIFYPFSGPDILNGIMFFPKAKNFIMLGLEPIGAIPSLEHANANSVHYGIQQVQISLGFILGRNYFITSDMMKKIGNHAFNGITGMMMFFISRMEKQVINVRKVYIDSLGQLQDYNKDAIDTAKNQQLAIRMIGVEITFRDPSQNDPSKFQKVVYFSGDATDKALSNKPEFFTYAMKFPKFFTMLKAASYLMFNKEFDDMRSLILANSSGVMQSASGMPFFFLNDGNWNLSLYGVYSRPIRDFINRCQPDMVKAFQEKSKGILPFSYDYDFKPGLSNLVVARRLDSFAYFAPKFDLRNDMGTDSYCQGNTYIKSRRYVDQDGKVKVEAIK